MLCNLEKMALHTAVLSLVYSYVFYKLKNGHHESILESMQKNDLLLNKAFEARTEDRIFFSVLC